ncbi:unnamed protein product, partial [Prorocentrum cordatum]
MAPEGAETASIGCGSPKVPGRPIQVHHQWTATSAALVLVLPKGYPAASLHMLQITDAHVSEEPLDRDEAHYAARMHAAFRVVPSASNGSAVRA